MPLSHAKVFCVTCCSRHMCLFVFVSACICVLLTLVGHVCVCDRTVCRVHPDEKFVQNLVRFDNEYALSLNLRIFSTKISKCSKTFEFVH